MKPTEIKTPTTLQVIKELTPTLFVVEVRHEGVVREVRMSRHEYLLHSALYGAIADLMSKRKKTKPAKTKASRRATPRNATPTPKTKTLALGV